MAPPSYWTCRSTAFFVPRGHQTATCSQPDHCPRLRTRLVSDCPVDRSTARYVVFHTADGWYESIDMFDVFHPQTILAYNLNGNNLPVGNGAPLRLRVERQCGYKNVKFLKSIEVVDSLKSFGDGRGSISADYGFHWFAKVNQGRERYKPEQLCLRFEIPPESIVRRKKFSKERHPATRNP